MFRNIYKRIDFLRNSSASFISWICPILRYINPIKTEFIYNEGDEIKYLYFNVHGDNAFVLTKFNNQAYIQVKQSSVFGFEDVASNLFEDFDDPEEYKESFEDWYDHIGSYKRVFSIQCKSEQSELYCLCLSELSRMVQEFSNEYIKLMKDHFMHLQKVVLIKEQSINRCKSQ